MTCPSCSASPTVLFQSTCEPGADSPAAIDPGPDKSSNANNIAAEAVRSGGRFRFMKAFLLEAGVKAFLANGGTECRGRVDLLVLLAFCDRFTDKLPDGFHIQHVGIPLHDILHARNDPISRWDAVFRDIHP